MGVPIRPPKEKGSLIAYYPNTQSNHCNPLWRTPIPKMWEPPAVILLLSIQKPTWLGGMMSSSGNQTGHQAPLKQKHWHGKKRMNKKESLTRQRCYLVSKGNGKVGRDNTFLMNNY